MHPAALPVRQVFAFSDTHVGSVASDAGKAQEAVIENGIRRADIVVIAGDAFENFTTGNDPQAQFALAKATFARWHAYNPKAEFHFLPGNHEQPHDMIRLAGDEAFYDFWPKIKAELGRYPNVQVHEKYCRIGDAVAVHGHLGTYKWEAPSSPLRLHTRDRLGGIGAPGTKLASFFFPMSQILPATHHMLTQALREDGDTRPVRKLLFGHTHYCLFDRKFDRPGLELGRDVSHYNLGCSVRHRAEQFQPISFELVGDLAGGTTRNFMKAKEVMRAEGCELGHDAQRWTRREEPEASFHAGTFARGR